MADRIVDPPAPARSEVRPPGVTFSAPTSS
jgi:hypothetical protein